VDYVICQVERAPTTGKVHLHAYLQFPTNKRFTALKRLSDRADWEIRRGTHEEAKAYCSKEDTRANGPWELGHEKIPQQGKRNDWALVSEKAKQGCSRRQILLDQPHLAPCVKGVDALIEAHLPPPPLQREIEVWYLYGETGTGKTHRAMTSFPQAFKIKGKYYEGKSFDDYKAEKVLILDEWDPVEWPLTFMNSILDKWECRLQCRYYNKTAYWEKVIITSNIKPDQCYPAVMPLQRGSFLRRLTHTVEVLDQENPLIDFGLAQVQAVPVPSAGSPLLPASLPLRTCSPTQPWPTDTPIDDAANHSGATGGASKEEPIVLDDKDLDLLFDD